MNTPLSKHTSNQEPTFYVILQDGFLAAEWEIVIEDETNESLQGSTDGRSYETFQIAARELCCYLDEQVEQARNAKAMLLSCMSFEDYQARLEA